MPVADFIDLPPEERAGKTPVLWEVENGTLARYAASAPVVALVEERRKNLRMLKSLAGV